MKLQIPERKRYMSETIKLTICKGTAGSFPILLGSASLATLDGISMVDQFVMETKEGVQRPLDKKHATDFRKYIERALHGEKVTAPPLILSLREKANIQNGYLLVPNKKSAMARLDAQHRMAFTADLDVELPFVIYYGITKEEEIEIFTTINDNQKGLQKSLVDSHKLALSANPEKEIPHIAIAAELNNDASSPWYQTVNTGGVSSQGTPGSKRKITLRTFQDANRVLISGPRCQNADYKEKYDAVRNFWQAVANTFPDGWTDNRKHLLMKGVGIAALADIGRDIIQECFANGDTSVAAISKYLKKLDGFDWGNKTSVLSLVGGQKGAAAAARAFNAVVFGNKEISEIAEMLMPLASAATV
jgi:DGQHR domain-containing protein